MCEFHDSNCKGSEIFEGQTSSSSSIDGEGFKQYDYGDNIYLMAAP